MIMEEIWKPILGYAECEDVWDVTYIFDTNALIECFRKAMEE